MSRNLCKDQCCGHRIELSELVGKPLEFRKYYDYRPVPGVKWQCPTCNRVYFIIIRTGHDYWGKNLKEQFDKDEISFGNGHVHENTNKGKFARRTKNFNGEEHIEELGWYEFDMSFYESYNDEGEGKDIDNPAHLCTKDDEKTRRDM